MSVQVAKDMVRGLWQELELWPQPFSLPHTAAFAPDVAFHGPAPIGDVVGRDALYEKVYAPSPAPSPSPSASPTCSSAARSRATLGSRRPATSSE